MQIYFNHKEKNYSANLSQPLDISIPLREGMENVNCFYAPPFSSSPVIAGDFVGSTKRGGPLNFLNISLNPHGNGTHTECVGHISKETYTINQCLKEFMFISELISLYPTKIEGDRVITQEQIEMALPHIDTNAIIIRTYPNDDLKLRTNYSGANPPYFEAGAIRYLVERGVQHLLVDLPSVDREEDGGKLSAHKAFWNYPENPQKHRTITELVYIPSSIRDGKYLLNLQIASFEIDVSPSKPVLYGIIEETKG